MKAIVWTAYGPPEVLELRDIEKPVPKKNEVLIKIISTTVTAGDCEVRQLKLPFIFSLPMRIYFGLARPKRVTVLGTEIAGEIESVGDEVTKFKVGDQVAGCTGISLGAYAEYVCIPEDGTIIIKPSNMTFDQAAAISIGGLESLHFLRKGNLKPGESILINGAGGSIGSYAVQLAKHHGAVITAVDAEQKLEMLRSIGADRVIDYAAEDFTKNGETYDIIFDVVGKSSFSSCIKSLKPNGRYLIANPRLSHMLRRMWVWLTGGKKVILSMADYKSEDLLSLRELIEAGKLKSIIDQLYPLEDIIEAHRYVEKGLKKGNVIITIGGDVKS